MKRSEIFKALEDGEIIEHIHGYPTEYKIEDNALKKRVRSEEWEHDNGDYLVKQPHIYQIKPKRVMDLSKVKPEEIKYDNGEKVLSIIEMYNSELDRRFVVVFPNGYGIYCRGGSRETGGKINFKFKEEIEG